MTDRNPTRNRWIFGRPGRVLLSTVFVAGAFLASGWLAYAYRIRPRFSRSWPTPVPHRVP